jgi:transcriptional regulator with XRE-family HTH domain
MSAYREALAVVEPRETFMQRLRSTLQLHGIPHAKLAWHAGVCPTQLSRWMRGRSEPNLESMLMLDEALSKVLYGGD